MSEFFNGNTGWYLLLAATVGDFVISELLAVFYKGYSRKSQTMFDLGGAQSPVRGFYNLWLLIFAALFICASGTFWSRYYYVAMPIAAFVVIAMVLFAMGASVMPCIFKAQDKKGISTVETSIHNISIKIGSCAVLTIPFALAAMSFAVGYYLSGTASLVCGGAAVAFFDRDRESEKGDSMHKGVWRRLVFFCAYLPMIMISLENILK